MTMELHGVPEKIDLCLGGCSLKLPTKKVNSVYVAEWVHQLKFMIQDRCGWRDARVA